VEGFPETEPDGCGGERDKYYAKHLDKLGTMLVVVVLVFFDRAS
jgi:hypothetical protein